jgi:PST family polysaccharide transporter
MIDRIKSILKEEENKRVATNFVSLTGLNFINYFFPIIVIPYLTRVLGVEKYGLYVFSFAIIQYLTLIVNYGFDYSATKYIAIHRDDKDKISEVVIGLTLFRLFLSFVCLIIIFILLKYVPALKKEYLLYLYGVGIFIGNSLTPLWLFQGMEQMKYVTIINFISKLISTLLIFIFVKQPADYSFVNLFYSLGYLVAGILSILLAFKAFQLKFKIPGLKFTIERIREGWSLFLSTVFMNFYRESNTIILGIIANYTIVGYYAAAEKIIKAVQSFIAPLSKAIYPYFGRKMNSENKKNAIHNLFTFNKYYAIGLSLIIITIIIFSPLIVKIFLGKNYGQSIFDLQILSLIIFFGGLNYTLGIVGMVNLSLDKQFTIFVFIAGITNIVSCVFLGKIFLDKGASLSLVLAEFILFILIILFFRRHTRTLWKS